MCIRDSGTTVPECDFPDSNVVPRTNFVYASMPICAANDELMKGICSIEQSKITARGDYLTAISLYKGTHIYFALLYSL